MENEIFFHMGYLYMNSHFQLFVNKNTDFDKNKKQVERGIKDLRSDQAHLSCQQKWSTDTLLKRGTFSLSF